MKRLDYKLVNGKPYSIQYKEDYKGVLVVESKTKNYFITMCPDLHYTISQMRFDMFNFPKEFGELNLDVYPMIFPSFVPSGSDLLNIIKAVKHFLIDAHGNSKVFSDNKSTESIDTEQLCKIFQSDEEIEEDVIEQKIQQAILEAQREAEIKKKRKQLDKFQSDMEKKYQAELKQFAKKNNISLPKEKPKGKDKLLWKMGSN